jgi:DNA-nicking Smr family endonuclease
MSDEDAQHFLLDMFPELDPLQLEQALAECAYNVEEAVNALLVHLHLRDSDHDTQPCNDDEQLCRKPSSSKRKNKRKPSRHKHVMQLGNASYMHHYEPAPVPTTNVWRTSDDAVQQLSMAFPHIKRDKIASLFVDYGRDLDRTMDALERLPDEEMPDADARVDDELLVQLIHMFPHQDVTKLASTLIACGNDGDAAIERLLTPQQPAVDVAKDYWVAQRVQREWNAPPSTNTTVTATSTTSATSTTAVVPISPSTPVDTPEYCRSRAHEFIQKRDESYRKAAHAFQQTDGQVAMFYANQAREYDRSVRYWYAQEAEVTVRSRKDGRYVVDLHGLTIAEAIVAAKSAANEWWAREAKAPLELITGRGNHSASGQSRLRPAIINALERDGWSIDANVGSIVVKGIK